ncbi:C4-dicarboxylate transporter DctA [Telmatospirillum siberiense]|uniref:C4-dicarboxylate transporter DctA n=1 Tax=Telmatospirillum siberiense TaxID=382514 RepID=A0A2N3PUG1_9PROT|nr:C4-dicarboxylate transporter DctA [Telmatospirillum siberiense]PKU24018.1 C4-dicarboxylate transporter DctA [Telmatospirillum siberiense]
MSNGTPFYRSLIFQMLVAVVIGSLVGYKYPDIGVALNPLAGGFIKLIKMIVVLLIFATVSVGVAKLGDIKKVGRIGIKSLVYFEIVSTIALAFGLLVVNLFKPGVGMNINPAELDAKLVAGYATNAQSLSVVDFILNIIPASAVNAFAQGNILQVLLFALFVGFALLHIGKRAQPLVDTIERWSEVIFAIVGAIMKLAPLAVFGAVGYTIGKFGIASLIALGKLVALFYLTNIFFMVVILGAIAYLSGFNLWKFIKYLSEELVLVFCTASSEAALPRLIRKLENAGCSVPVVGFVVPTGYSFNLDGSYIYLTMSAIFIAQATNIDLSMAQQLGLLGIFLLTSKGVAGVTAGGFVVLAGTLSIFPDIPLVGLGLLLGIERFMDSMRTATNLLGNGVATMVIAKWERQRDDRRMLQVLNGEATEPLPEAELVEG